MNNELLSRKAIVHQGNLSALVKVLKKATRNEEVTIGFIGGSITMGTGASSSEKCYAYRVYEWWLKKFPSAKIQYVNAGIGATTSHFAVARVHCDLLKCNPDFVLEEFSVNDENTEFYEETFEGLTRTILQYNNTPALMVMNNVFYDSGKNAQEIHNKIGINYDLPILSMKNSLYQEVESGRLTSEDITIDHLHPNDYGHELIATIITNFLEQVYEEYIVGKKELKEYSIPVQSVSKNRFVDAIRYNNKNYHPEMEGFELDKSRQEKITDVFKNGWIGKKKGGFIEFRITGSLVALQYRKTIQRPAPVAIAIIDGQEENPIILDANFEEDWGDCLYLQNLILEDEVKEHKIKIKLKDEDKSEKGEFYISSLIVANRD